MIDDWVSQGETTVQDTDGYYFAIEEFKRGDDQMVFIHLTVHKMTVSVFKEIIANWKRFRECVTCPLYAVGGVEDTVLWEHFVSLLGFKPLQQVICNNGAERRLFIHTKEETNERVVTADQPNHECV